MNVVEINKISKKFGNHIIFNNFSMVVCKNEFVVIKGGSGSGKSTLLNMIGLLDKPDSGTIQLFDKKNVKPFSRTAESILKNRIGYLFQNFALIENKTVLYNMKLAVEHFHRRKDKKEQIDRVLKLVGLENIKNKKVFECSGGEQQRIALSRLLLKPCDLILADEPTGSLDVKNKEIVFSLLKELQEKNNKTIIVVSHDPDIEKIADRIINI